MSVLGTSGIGGVSTVMLTVTAVRMYLSHVLQGDKYLYTDSVFSMASKVLEHVHTTI